MTNLEKLKMKLYNKNYFTDVEYTNILKENGLNASAIYDKQNDEVELLESVVEVLENLSADTDLMRKIDSKDIMSVGEATKWLFRLIDRYKEQIQQLKLENNTNSRIKHLFCN